MGWQALQTELDRWQTAGKRATFWWRDDDAVAPTPALDTLIKLANDHKVPLGLAVIPAHAEAALAQRIAHEKFVTVLQHGFQHKNHEPGTGKSVELGDARPAEMVLEELRRGKKLLAELFGDKFHPALVPPWNRISPTIIDALHGLGFRGYSGFGAREAREDALIPVHTHCDIIKWKPKPPRFRGEEKCLEEVVLHLAARRLGSVDATEPTGYLTHHLAHDEGCWQFTQDFFARTCAHPATLWLEPKTIF